MDKIYEDISRRTNGDIYIGVVGPVRTGKSTFIKRFMEVMVLPEMDNVYRRERARDELPQSGSGRTIMTAEPKFIPEDAADILFENGSHAAIRLIDCVGFMIPGAEGLTEDGQERLVSTPWLDEQIPLDKAAEIGTKKVIAEHSTISLLMTTDGSIGAIPRNSYIEAEELVAKELENYKKPYIILLNSSSPKSENTLQLAAELAEKYQVPCLPINSLTMDEEDINVVMNTLLYQFPIQELSFYLPSWIEVLSADNPLKKEVNDYIYKTAGSISKLCDYKYLLQTLELSEEISSAKIKNIDAGCGKISATLELSQGLYYNTISEQSGFDITDDGDLMELLRSLKSIKAEYDSVHEAIEEAKQNGYGLVKPTAEQMVLHEPQIVSRSGHYSVKLKAAAPALHIIRTDVETEVSPAVGGEKASEEILGFLLQGFDGDVTKIWDSNIFGKSLYDIAEEGLTNKLRKISPNICNRMRLTMQKVVNDGAYSVICIII